MARPLERPFALITIDTEGDNLWARLPRSETRNAAFLPRFQALCDRYRLRVTYLVDFDMAHSPQFREFAGALLAAGTAEIGAHLHAWNTPPLVPRTADDLRFHPYLIEYPPATMRAKLATLTDVLETMFGTKMRSHRAGRWALNAVYARLLVEAGYEIDCSVTPHVSWRATGGAPDGVGGTDYRGFPDRAYFVDLDDIRRPGASPLLEIPITIRATAPSLIRDHRLMRRVLGRFFRLRWFRPDGRNLADLLRLIEEAVRRGHSYIQFMLHSSELMPGGSPAFPSVADIDRLYGHLDALFAVLSTACRPGTLREYRAWAMARRAAAPEASAPALTERA